nr:MAG TPA: hypothetical protein [Caudoviricetes sp.]DAS91558.1 MAG TPA: hypothetical protein [Caudoviricetes sp.]
MRAEMVVGDIFMVITSTGRRTSEALRGFAPPAFSAFRPRKFQISTIHTFPYQYRTSTVSCRYLCDKSQSCFADFCERCICENLNNLYKET